METPVETVASAAKLALTLANILFISILSAGCSGRQGTVGLDTTEKLSSATLREYSPPAPSPPTARLNGETLRRAGGFWRIADSIKDFSPKKDSEVAINDGSKEDTWNIEIDSPAVPMTAEIRLFRDLSPTGLPVSQLPDESFDCFEEFSGCVGRVKSPILDIELKKEIVAESGIYVLEMTYPTEEVVDRAEGLNHYAVSWVIRR